MGAKMSEPKLPHERCVIINGSVECTCYLRGVADTEADWRTPHRTEKEVYDRGQADERAKAAAVVASLTELLEVGDLRGDTTLPHPSDDPLLWTARMQEAWDESRAALAAYGESYD